MTSKRRSYFNVAIMHCQNRHFYTLALVYFIVIIILYEIIMSALFVFKGNDWSSVVSAFGQKVGDVRLGIQSRNGLDG